MGVKRFGHFCCGAYDLVQGLEIWHLAFGIGNRVWVWGLAGLKWSRFKIDEMV